MKRGVVILTGFLGSGKTTLLRGAMRKRGGAGVPVIVNELGEVSLDHHLLRELAEQVRPLGGGCACCVMRDDLVGSLKDLLSMEARGEIPRIERVVIETTGLADPAPIIFTITMDPVLQHHFTVDRVIATVSGLNGSAYLERHEESRKQVMIADFLVITKTDIAERLEVRRLAEKLSLMNPFARIIESSHGDIDPGVFFDPAYLGAERAWGGERLSAAVRGAAPTEARSVSIIFEEPLDWVAFGIWLSMLLYARGEDVLRVKGILRIGEEDYVSINGVQHIIHPPQHIGRIEGPSRLVFITKNIDPTEILRSMKAFQELLGASPRLDAQPQHNRPYA